MATIQERCANFLAQGLAPAQVASIVGISPGRLSQIVKEESFSTVLAAARERYEVSEEDAAVAERINNKYLALEDKLVDSLYSQATMMEPRDLVRALDTVSSRQARLKQAAAPVHAVQNNYTVQLALPAHAVPEYKLNAQSEIISIDNRPMAPLPAQSVKELFHGMKAASDMIEAHPADF